LRMRRSADFVFGIDSVQLKAGHVKEMPPKVNGLFTSLS